MRILSVVGKQYYGAKSAVEPMYIYFTEPLRDLGHAVDTFDHMKTTQVVGMEKCGELFLETVRNGHYDMVLYQTAGGDRVPRDYIRKATAYSTVVAWNSDDDWQWESYTKNLCEYFTFMVTTYPSIFEANRERYPNLRCSQWGCYERFGDFNRTKDLDFTFAGNVYEHRNWECRYLKKRAGLQTFGAGSRLVRMGLPYFRLFTRVLSFSGRPVDFHKMNEIWNRSKVSYTPQGALINPRMLQIKSRTFEMGLSGTLMVSEPSPSLERYYVPGKEFVPFHNLDECARIAEYYLENESERARIARAYHDRTGAEHLWRHRFTKLFREFGLPTSG